MPIEKITVIISPNPRNYPDGELPENRVLTYDRTSKKWSDNQNEGFFTGEIKLIDAINKVRNDYGDV